MQFTLPKDCSCHPDLASPRGLSGMGNWWVPLATTAMQMYGKKNGGDGGGEGQGGADGGMPGVTVQTVVTSNVNPQISPVFIQQDQPQDSPVIAGTSMGPGTVPQTGMLPGFDSILPALSEYTHNINKPLLYGSFALLALAIGAKVYMNRNKRKAAQ